MIKRISILAAVLATGLMATNAIADDNIAACEIVVQQPVVSNDEAETDSAEAGLEGTPMIATFIPAGEFVYSVFDEEPGHMTEVHGHPIQAIMCKRRYLVPTEFDLRLIETRIPLYLSQDFDSTSSDLMAVFFKDDKFRYEYSGKDLGSEAQEILEYRMEYLNGELDQSPETSDNE